jgi:predicted amidohydrolase YtcJ
VAKTAFLTQPYLKPPHGMAADYKAYPSVTQEELDRWFDLAWRNNLQLLVHCNGDAAADQMLHAARKAIAQHGRKDLRPVMIHAQFVRQDQLDAMVALGITPSFFSGHTYYWGDWHINETVGPARAFGMSPMASAKKKGLRFTNHSDAPVVPIDQLMTMWTAVNRVSRSGVVVGPEERISALDALRAVTLDAAWQYFEEQRKGSIEVGKLADLVILDQNPLAVAPMAIRDIRVLETIKEGRTVWKSA